MSRSTSARREYLQAIADFERGCREFSSAVAGVLDQDVIPAPPTSLLAEMGPRKPMRRAVPIPAASRTSNRNAS